MATLSAVSAKHATLVAATLDTVTLTATASRVIIKNRATTAGNCIFATVNGPTPTAGGDDTIAVPAGETYTAAVSPMSSTDNVIKLISATADAYSVMVEG